MKETRACPRCGAQAPIDAECTAPLAYLPGSETRTCRHCGAVNARCTCAGVAYRRE